MAARAAAGFALKLKTPYGDAALAFYDAGLCPIPSGGSDGKVPLVRWKDWKQRPGRDVVEAFARKFASANIGILTGPLSGITIVDCDNPKHLALARARFGETSTETTTSRGVHLWYRSSGESSSNLRQEGLDIDVKGAGGFSVEPPSWRRSGPQYGVSYAFTKGSLALIRELPHILSGALGSGVSGTRSGGSRTILEGERNGNLLSAALALAHAATSADDLCRQLIDVNAMHCKPPLSAREVASIARSAWGYQVSGRNWSGTGGFRCHNDRLASFSGPDAFFLLAVLRKCHAARAEPFALVPEAMARAGTIPGLSANRIRAARDELLALRLLRQVHQGGRGPKDPSLFVLQQDPASLPD